MAAKPPIFRRLGQPRNKLERDRAYDRQRPSPTERGYDKHWWPLRAAFLQAHPICSVVGCGRLAQEVDHIMSIRERPALRLAWSNLRAMCKSCHSRRTARDQGFARPGRRQENEPY